ncbi:uncharacterized protein LOC111089272 [Limulus polyphemus]|uniref:Uncharacterized protein LOC111089272 n=1 Tax=Limulus polyphemus TaxID=6850 RepID=A0ABM1TMR2_LIMPO|nr:uncharacterized protein LOC111089272 [Limulus polyphemus]
MAQLPRPASNYTRELYFMFLCASIMRKVPGSVERHVTDLNCWSELKSESPGTLKTLRTINTLHQKILTSKDIVFRTIGYYLHTCVILTYSLELCIRHLGGSE